MVSVKKLIAAGAALSMVATPVLAASTSHVQNAAKDIRVGSHVNTAESEGLFDEHKTRDLLLLLLLLGGGAGLYFALHSTSP